MASYQYKGRDSSGSLVEGVLEAATADAVAGQLMNIGITPVDITQQVNRSGDGDIFEEIRKFLTTEPPELEDLILFSRQMYTLMRAGVPINQAMGGLIRSTRNRVLVEALGQIQTDLESGRDFSTGLARHPKIFPSLFVNTIRIGESTGQLDEALLKLSDYLELERDTRARIKSALRYPTFVIIAITLAMAIINVVVIPQFTKVFKNAGVDLPIYTRILIGTSDFFVAYWVPMVVGIVVLAIAVRKYVNTERGRFVWDQYKIRIPIIGSILYRATLGRFARSFSMSLSAGVPLLQSLSVVSRAIDNLLAEVAGFYEREVDYDIKNLAQTIEPVLIVVIAGMVLVLALGVFLPMWDLASVKLNR